MLRLEQVAKEMVEPGQASPVIKEISLELNKPEVVALVGPNGSGKTTLLNMIAGLDSATSGTILWKDQSIEQIKPRVGFLFQNYQQSLFPWQTVTEHLAFALRHQPYSAGHKQRLISTFLTQLKLTEHQAKYPYELSGGMQQLVALGRVLLFEPELLIFDEPFAALDYHTAIKIQEFFAEWWEEHPVPALLVTHTLDEAIYLADRIIVISERPSRIVAEFTVDLPRPRRFEHRHHPHFLDVRQQLLHTMRSFL